MTKKVEQEKQEKKLEKQLSKLWHEKVKEACEEFKVDAVKHSKRLKELGNMYATATMNLYKIKMTKKGDLFEAESIRENYDMAIEAFLKKMAKKEAKKVKARLIELLEKSGGIIMSFAVVAFKAFIKRI